MRYNIIPLSKPISFIHLTFAIDLTCVTIQEQLYPMQNGISFDCDGYLRYPLQTLLQNLL